MDRLIHAAILAIDVIEHIWMQHRMIESSVECGLLRGRTTGDLDSIEDRIPRIVSLLSDRVEGGSAGIFGVQVGLRVGQADIRDAYADIHRGGPGGKCHEPAGAVTGWWEAIRAERGGTAAGDAALCDRRVDPRSGAGERLVEYGDEEQLVIALASLRVDVAAEVATGHRAGDRARRDVDARLRGATTDLRVRGPDQHRRWRSGRVREPAGAGPRRRRELDVDSRSQPDLIEAGSGGLVGVREVARIDRVGGVGGRRRGYIAGD